MLSSSPYETFCHPDDASHAESSIPVDAWGEDEEGRSEDEVDFTEPQTPVSKEPDGYVPMYDAPDRNKNYAKQLEIMNEATDLSNNVLLKKAPHLYPLVKMWSEFVRDSLSPAGANVYMNLPSNVEVKKVCYGVLVRVSADLMHSQWKCGPKEDYDNPTDLHRDLWYATFNCRSSASKKGEFRVRGWDNMDIGLKGKPFPNFKTKEDPNKDIEWVGSGPECLFRKFDKTGLYLCGDFIPGWLRATAGNSSIRFLERMDKKPALKFRLFEILKIPTIANPTSPVSWQMQPFFPQQMMRHSQMHVSPQGYMEEFDYEFDISVDASKFNNEDEDEELPTNRVEFGEMLQNVQWNLRFLSSLYKLAQRRGNVAQAFELYCRMQRIDMNLTKVMRAPMHRQQRLESVSPYALTSPKSGKRDRRRKGKDKERKLLYVDSDDEESTTDKIENLDLQE